MYLTLQYKYAQSHPQTIMDPLSGQSESIAGYLTLSEVEQEGTNGAALNAPEINMRYTNLHEHYSESIRLGLCGECIDVAIPGADIDHAARHR